MSEPMRVIAGFGRSGTTWVQDAVAEANQLRTVFEPLHPNAVRGASKFAHACLDAHADNPELRDLLGRFAEGDFRSLWVDYRIRDRWFLPRLVDLTRWTTTKSALKRMARSREYFVRYNAQRQFPRRLIKLVRANMMLSWLKTQMGAQIVFVLRHPAPVVLSNLKSPRSWRPFEQLAIYREDRQLLASVDHALQEMLSAPLEDIEAHTLCWCIENQVALQQAAISAIPVVHYEHLIENGDREWTRIVDGLNLDRVPAAEVVSRPSQQAYGERANDPTLV